MTHDLRSSDRRPKTSEQLMFPCINSQALTCNMNILGFARRPLHFSPFRQFCSSAKGSSIPTEGFFMLSFSFMGTQVITPSFP